MANGWHKFAVSMENITLAGDTGDFFQLRGATTPFRVLEAQVWQRGGTAVVTDTLAFRRGTGGAAGAALTQYEYNTAGPAPTCTAFSLPTTDVSLDWRVLRGWNLLQEATFLPIPELWVPHKSADDFAIGREGVVAHTGVGCTVIWEEFVGS